jgi:ABC-type proline/glycine betaine transport system ATPase subunit
VNLLLNKLIITHGVPNIRTISKINYRVEIRAFPNQKTATILVSAMSRVGLQYRAEASHSPKGLLRGSQKQRSGVGRLRSNEEAEKAVRK